MKNITKPEKTTQELENDVTAKQIKCIDLYWSASTGNYLQLNAQSGPVIVETRLIKELTNY